MVDLNDIIDRYAVVIPSPPVDERYECEDGFIAVYNETEGKALYFFKDYQGKPLEAIITPDQRNYFVRSGYWKPV
jgi:hypothetical protein